MKRLKYLMIVVGIIQLVLGVLYLLVPHQMLAWMGHSPVPADTAYPLGMLSARFIVYGLLMIIATRDPERNRLLIIGMSAIQLIDLTAGVFYTAHGIVSLQLSAFPMFNAVWIGGLLWCWLPKSSQARA